MRHALHRIAQPGSDPLEYFLRSINLVQNLALCLSVCLWKCVSGLTTRRQTAGGQSRPISFATLSFSESAVTHHKSSKFSTRTKCFWLVQVQAPCPGSKTAFSSRVSHYIWYQCGYYWIVGIFSFMSWVRVLTNRMPLIAALISSKEICQALDVLHACGSGAATTVTYFPDGARMGAPCAFLLTLAGFHRQHASSRTQV